MKNHFISPRAASDIDRAVELILSDLGAAEPPVQLDLVLDLLELDLKFYSTEDPGFMQRAIHKMRIAGKQVLKRPTLLVDAIKKLDVSALWIPDRKRILIDESKPKIKHRWLQSHEIGHKITPWHESVLHGDTSHTLSIACHEEVEAEANYAAGRLLFMQERFAEEAFASSLSLDEVRRLAKRFGNTLSCTLWRYVESVPSRIPMVGVIGSHPEKMMFGIDPSEHCRYFIRSSSFAKQFSTITAGALLKEISGYCAWRKGGPLGEKVVILTNDRGEEHEFHFASFYNRYDVLTLGYWQRERSVKVEVR